VASWPDSKKTCTFDLSSALDQQGVALIQAGRTAEGRRQLERALGLVDSLLKEEPDIPLYQDHRKAVVENLRHAAEAIAMPHAGPTGPPSSSP
jgi:hypothetical protein